MQKIYIQPIVLLHFQKALAPPSETFFDYLAAFFSNLLVRLKYW